MLTDTACKNLKPKAKPYKKSDGGGLHLLVQPTGAKLWRMAYRFGDREKKLSFGAYPDVTLVAARDKRDDAKRQLAEGTDPGVAKKEAKRKQATAKTLGQWIEAWLDKERNRKQPLDAKTLRSKERYAAYIKAEFGSLLPPAVKRPDVLEYLKRIEQKGTLETRDRVRSTGEQVYVYADVEGTDYNPFRNLQKQLLENVSTPRAAITEPATAVAKLMQDIAAPSERVRFDDVVGYALRFIALTAARPGNVDDAEWFEIDFDAERWTIPAHKMKKVQGHPRRKHIVPLSRQAVALLREVHKLTGHRKFVFSCSADEPISDNTLNKRLREIGYDTSTQHCAHGFRSTFSTWLNGETDGDDNKRWDGDVIELQLAHLDKSSVKAIYDRTGPESLMGARAKAMQYWADRIDAWVGDNVVPMRKPGLAVTA